MDSTIARRLAAQDGIITMSQALEAGLSRDAVQRRLTSKDWMRVASGVYLAAGHPKSHRTRARAAVFSAGKGAVAHGLTAAWWHGLVDNPPARPHITIPLRRTIQRSNASLRRRDIPAADVDTIDGLAVTRIPLTLLEVGDTVLIDRALQTGVSLADLTSSNERNRSRRGYSSTRRILEIAADGGRSEAERRLHRLIRHLPGWSAQFPIAGFTVDAAFEEAKVAIEVDGWRWHKDARRNAQDMKRQNAIALRGWTVLRFDWHSLTSDGARVQREIEAALKR